MKGFVTQNLVFQAELFAIMRNISTSMMKIMSHNISIHLSSESIFLISSRKLTFHVSKYVICHIHKFFFICFTIIRISHLRAVSVPLEYYIANKPRKRLNKNNKIKECTRSFERTLSFIFKREFYLILW